MHYVAKKGIKSRAYCASLEVNLGPFSQIQENLFQLFTCQIIMSSLETFCCVYYKTRGHRKENNEKQRPHLMCQVGMQLAIACGEFKVTALSKSGLIWLMGPTCKCLAAVASRSIVQHNFPKPGLAFRTCFLLIWYIFLGTIVCLPN